MADEPKDKVKLYWSEPQRGGYLRIDKIRFNKGLMKQSIPLDSNFIIKQYAMSTSRNNRFKIMLRFYANGDKTSNLYIDKRGNMAVYLKSSTLKAALKKSRLPTDIPRERMLFRRYYVNPIDRGIHSSWPRKNQIHIILVGGIIENVGDDD